MSTYILYNGSLINYVPQLEMKNVLFADVVIIYEELKIHLFRVCII